MCIYRESISVFAFNNRLTSLTAGLKSYASFNQSPSTRAPTQKCQVQQLRTLNCQTGINLVHRPHVAFIVHTICTVWCDVVCGLRYGNVLCVLTEGHWACPPEILNVVIIFMKVLEKVISNGAAGPPEAICGWSGPA